MGAGVRTTPRSRLPGRMKALQPRSCDWSRSPGREAMSPGGGRRLRPDIEPPVSHRERVLRWPMLILGAAPTTRWILADGAPDLDRSPLVIRRAADHGEHLRGLVLEHVSIVDFDV